MTTKLMREVNVQVGHVRFDDIPSPCIGVCRLVGTVDGPICRGCYRYVEEIAKWARLSSAEKRACVGQIAGRQAKYDIVDKS